jgi:hypothetical protein
MNLRSDSAGVAGRARVLLLHPEDRYPMPGLPDFWDLIVDFGRAAPDTHLRWGRNAGCRVLSIFDFAEDLEDLYRTKELLQFGMGGLVDRFGIDWWDVLSIMIFPEFMNLMMVQRLATKIGSHCELYMSRPISGAYALSWFLGVPLHNLEGRSRSWQRRTQHYFRGITRLDPAQTLQILQDKFDRTHSLRSRLTRRPRSPRKPIVLLPSAYGNVSRTAISFAAAFPDNHFQLVYARAIARVEPVPRNVQTSSLDAYFTPVNKSEIASLSQGWMAVRKRMISAGDEFAAADKIGVLGRISSLLPWGIAMRDAWMNVFDAEDVIACLSADDSNPYTRLPLIVAQKRNVPAIACHHGALDYSVAVKKNHADVYLTKSEMERHYVTDVCRMQPDALIAGPFEFADDFQQVDPFASSRSWLVFFSEYSTAPWRGEEMYRELMPAMAALANRCGLQLVLKIHPFENKKSYQRWVKRYLPAELGRAVSIVTGPPSVELWSKARFAITIQSTAAMECHARGIPVFLCKWLRELHCAYQEQFARFGIGRVLQTADEIAEIPRLLESWKAEPMPGIAPGRKLVATKLQDLFQLRAVSPV